MRKVMSEDLISRNALLEELKSFSMTITGLNNSTYRFVAEQCKKSIMRIVDEQPTAYDVDKVVKQLSCEKCSDCQLEENCVANFGDGFMEKIRKIVKAGGVNE